MTKKTNKKSNLVQPILMVLLVGAAFAIGSMWTQLKGLKSGPKEVAKEEVVAPKQEEANELTGEMWAELQQNPAGMKGEEGATISIVELTDYQCPFCKRYVDQAYQQIETDYVETGKVKYMLKDLPLSFHANSQVTAEVARCAGDQDKYWEMHDKLFETQEAWSEVTDTKLFKTYAGQLGLNQAEFNTCLDEGKFEKAVKDDLALAQKVGANGTPTFFINGKKLVGAQPFAAFKTIIDQELK